VIPRHVRRMFSGREGVSRNMGRVKIHKLSLIYETPDSPRPISSVEMTLTKLLIFPYNYYHWAEPKCGKITNMNVIRNGAGRCFNPARVFFEM